ncbi:MAG: DUF2752 domain-containing protein, partial [Planctomycetales bacterium]|nr:DUF2752 domain-containing protein [Planctomycetales bacterium]
MFSGVYFSTRMTKDNTANSEKKRVLSPAARLAAAGIFLAITAVFGLLWASGQGHIDLSRWLGICGFKQRFGLPCPGCGWTHAAQRFVQGHPAEAFEAQPAAMFFCSIAAIAAIFALHVSVFGIDFRLSRRLFGSTGAGILIIAAILIILAGWVVTLARTLLE